MAYTMNYKKNKMDHGIHHEFINKLVLNAFLNRSECHTVLQQTGGDSPQYMYNDS